MTCQSALKEWTERRDWQNLQNWQNALALDRRKNQTVKQMTEAAEAVELDESEEAEHRLDRLVADFCRWL